MTRHEEFILSLKEASKKAGKNLGPQAQKATHRPTNHCELSAEEQWAIDKKLGILDWDGHWDS